MLDELFLMRNSFAHTVENMFALSFLVHDGQASISADETGSRFACKIGKFTLPFWMRNSTMTLKLNAYHELFHVYDH